MEHGRRTWLIYRARSHVRGVHGAPDSTDGQGQRGEDRALPLRQQHLL